jgi:transposase
MSISFFLIACLLALQWLVNILECSREALLVLERGMARCIEQIEALAKPAKERPKGLGALSEQIISNEVLDWHRFRNRRQVSSYTGLCPSEFSSGGARRQGAITRHGNRRLRTALVEAAWRLMRHQPGWKRLEKGREKMLAAQSGRVKPGSKKKIAVELARCLAVDLWRLNTGRATLQDLGLEPA